MWILFRKSKSTMQQHHQSPLNDHSTSQPLLHEAFTIKPTPAATSENPQSLSTKIHTKIQFTKKKVLSRPKADRIHNEYIISAWCSTTQTNTGYIEPSHATCSLESKAMLRKKISQPSVEAFGATVKVAIPPPPFWYHVQCLNGRLTMK